jgi:hypothetical protein
LPHLEEADDDGEGHEEVDDGVGDIDDEDGDEVEVLLVDQGEVEDESDRQGHQGKQPCKNNRNTRFKKSELKTQSGVQVLLERQDLVESEKSMLDKVYIVLPFIL